MKHIVTHVVDDTVMRRAEADIEHVVKYRLTQEFAHHLVEFHDQDITAARLRDTWQIEYRMTLHVHTQKQLDEYVEYRIREDRRNRGK